MIDIVLCCQLFSFWNAIIYYRTKEGKQVVRFLFYWEHIFWKLNESCVIISFAEFNNLLRHRRQGSTSPLFWSHNTLQMQLCPHSRIRS